MVDESELLSELRLLGVSSKKDLSLLVRTLKLMRDFLRIRWFKLLGFFVLSYIVDVGTAYLNFLYSPERFALVESNKQAIAFLVYGEKIPFVQTVVAYFSVFLLFLFIYKVSFNEWKETQKIQLFSISLVCFFLQKFLFLPF